MKRRDWVLWGGVGLLLLAAVLRFYQLEAQSFWNDEGNTARLVERSVPLILKGAAADIHPPGYYLLLHVWRAGCGASEFALRGFSALCGVLTVAVAIALGRRSGGWRTAWAAGGFVAGHPLLVYYSQEARMYTLLGLAASLTLWAMVSLVEGRARWATAGLTVCIALGLYTQYTYLFALLALDLAFVGWWWPRREWKVAGRWAVAHLLAGGVFLPWLPIAVHALGWRPPDLAEAHALRDMASSLLVGITMPTSSEVRLGWWLLAGGSVLALASRPRSFAAWASLSMAFVPALLIAALGVYRPAYLKFLTASVVPLGVWLALPWRLSGRWGRYAMGLAGGVLAGLMWLQGVSLGHLYFDPAYARDDYRGLARFLTQEVHPGDAILLSAPNQWEVFTYYFHAATPVIPAPYHPAEDEARRWVDRVTSQYRRLWVLFWGDGESDPQRRLEPLLAQWAYPARQSWVGDVRLTVYGTAGCPLTPTVPLSATLGGAISLRGFALPGQVYYAGELVPLTLFWEAHQAPERRYKVFVHLLDGSGKLVAQYDAEPQGGFMPTVRWEPGAHIVDRCGLWLPDSLPAGEYTMRVGMYDLSGSRLRWHGDGASRDALTLSKIAVREWSK